MNETLIEVTQADREAAYAMFKHFNPGVQGAGNGALGSYCDDGEVVQAFARHAAEARATLETQLAEVREALERLLRRFNEAGLHITRLDLPFGSQAADVEFARAALSPKDQAHDQG